MVLVEKWPFFQLFFLGNIVQENFFYDIPERKIAFLGYKNKNFKTGKIDIFSKGGGGHYRPGKCLLRFFQNGKSPFQVIKTKKFKSRKIGIFPNGLTHGFGLIIAIFPTFWSKKCPFFQLFFLSQIRLGKCLLRYYRMENRFSRL